MLRRTQVEVGYFPEYLSPCLVAFHAIQHLQEILKFPFDIGKMLGQSSEGDRPNPCFSLEKPNISGKLGLSLLLETGKQVANIAIHSGIFITWLTAGLSGDGNQNAAFSGKM